MRKNLKIFRIQKSLTQDEIAKKIGCTRATYSAIESGKRSGRRTFWLDLQAAFGISDGEMWALMKNDE